MDNWHEEFGGRLESSRELLERAKGARSPREAECLLHLAIVELMFAVELFNDNFRFKVTHHGQTN